MVFLPVKNSNKIEDNRARQICPKTPSISSYQGKLACQSMVVHSMVSISVGKGELDIRQKECKKIPIVEPTAFTRYR